MELKYWLWAYRNPKKAKWLECIVLIVLVSSIIYGIIYATH